MLAAGEEDRRKPADRPIAFSPKKQRNFSQHSTCHHVYISRIEGIDLRGPWLAELPGLTQHI